MRIWIDADACPNMIKDILCRAAERTKIEIIFVANKLIRVVPSPFIKTMVVGGGFDVADNKIIQELGSGDLVISADIPLIDAAISKGAWALNPRGELYTTSNIKERLAMRNLSDSLRSNGLIMGGPPKLTKKDIQIFANALDRFLTSQR